MRLSTASLPTLVAVLGASMACLASRDAVAADDVSLSSMLEHDGKPVLDPVTVGADYEQLIRDLGSLVGTNAMAPPATTGLTGFEVTLETALGFHDLYDRSQRAFTGTPSPWDRAMADETSPSLLSATGIGLRKGLPYSIELELKGRWIGVSRQGTIGGGVRAAILEGKRGWPDLGFHLSYTGYVGNRELKLGALDVGMSLGGTAIAGREGTVRTARIQPWVDVSLLSVTAAPMIPADDAALLGAVAYGRRSPDPDGIPTTRALLMPRFTLGLQLDAPHFLVRVTGGYTLNATAFAGVAIGFRR